MIVPMDKAAYLAARYGDAAPPRTVAGPGGRSSRRRVLGGTRVVDDDEVAWDARRDGDGTKDLMDDEAPVLVDQDDRIRQSSSLAAVQRRRVRLDSDDEGTAAPTDVSPPRRSTVLAVRAPAVGAAAAAKSMDASSPRRGLQTIASADASPPRRRVQGATTLDAVQVPAAATRRAADADISPPRRGEAPLPRQLPPPPPTAADAADRPSATMAKMASGATAGLHTGRSFRQEQTQIRRADAGALAGGSAALLGATAATVYREAGTGRVLDVADEVRKAAVREAAAAAARIVERYEWSMGAASKAAAAEAAAEVAAAAAAPLTRVRGADAEVEALLKAAPRLDDPMARFAPGAVAAVNAVSGRPLYSGPEGPRNRYGLRPGYRWDGVPRGNGWEGRIVDRGSRRAARSEKAYAYSTADM